MIAVMLGFEINAKKTKIMTFNVDFEQIRTLTGKDVSQAVTESGEGLQTNAVLEWPKEEPTDEHLHFQR